MTRDQRMQTLIKVFQERREFLQTSQQTITPLLYRFLLQRLEHHHARPRREFQLVDQAAIFSFQRVAERPILRLPELGVTVKSIRVSLDHCRAGFVPTP